MAQKRTSTELMPAVTRGARSVVKSGRLPVSEFAFDRSGAASPFGDDLRLPLPVEQLTYVHPVPPDGSAGNASHH